ncbi:TraT complement resistance family protein, partial [mine drainage metagenome]
MQRLYRRYAALGFIILTTSLAGCATATGPAPTQTSSSGLSAGHMQLSVQTSASIFLQPVPPNKRVVFVEGHNTSSAQGLRFGSMIRSELARKGYVLTNYPNKATYMLMYNILYLGKEQHGYTAAGALAGGYGGALIGGAVTNSAGGAFMGGALGA